MNKLAREHKASTETELNLVIKMAEHYWSSQRAMILQGGLLNRGLHTPEQEKRFALYLRYQTTHDRAYSKCLNDLLRLQKERRNAELDEAAPYQRAEDSSKAFESQKAKQARESERAASHQAAEERKKELHHYAVSIARSRLALLEERKNAGQTAEGKFEKLLKRAFLQ